MTRELLQEPSGIHLCPLLINIFISDLLGNLSHKKLSDMSGIKWLLTLSDSAFLRFSLKYL